MASAAPPRSTQSTRHPVVEKVAAARSGAIRRVRLRGTAWAFCAGLAIVLGMMLLDAMLRQDDFGTRWFLSLVTLGGVIAAVVWWMVPAWQWNPSLLQIAQRIERFFPEMRDKISSALFFLEQEEADAAGSSPYFRRRHVNQMADVLGYTDVSVALNRHLAQRALYAVAALTTLLLLVFFFAPQTVSTAAARLAQPWKAISWPRVHNLVLVDPPTVVPLGGRANIEVADQNNNLPETAELQVRYEEGTSPVTHPMQFDFASQSLVYQMEGVQRRFEFRVVGGDDDTMPWHAVEVVQPPKFSDIQVTLVPPEYTRWLPSESPRSIIALEGTALEIRGAVDQPVTAAHVILESSGKASKFPLQIGEDGRSFFASAETSAAPLLSASGSYWIEVVLKSGLVKGEGQRHPMRVVSDKVPVINWIEPTQNLTLTPQAVVDLVASVRDDLAVQEIRLAAYPSGSEAALLTESLLQGPADRPFVSAPSNLSMGAGDPHTVTYSLDLAKLPDLKPGTVLELVVAADDYRPEVGESLPRMITIISEEQLEQRVNRQQREIITKLAEARRLQQDARQQTRSVEIQLEEASKLGPAELANLQNGEQNQKSVREKLAAARDSAAAKINALLTELAQNRQQEHDAANILQELKEKIDRVTDAGLDPIEAELTELRRNLPRGDAARPSQNSPADQERNPTEAGPTEEGPDEAALTEPDETAPDQELPTEGAENRLEDPTGQPPAAQPPAAQPAAQDAPSPAEMKQRLAEIGKQQEEVAAQLQDWQNELTRWDTFQRFAMDVRDLAARQEELAESVAQKQGETLGQDVERMSPETRADLKRMAEQQAGLAGELDRIQSRMREMLKNNPQSEEVVNTLQDAIDQNRDAAVSQRMRQAGERIEQNQLSGAKQSQEQVASSLENVLDTLQNRRETDKKELLRKLDEAKKELQEMQERQKELRSKAKQAASQQEGSQQQGTQQDSGQDSSEQNVQQQQQQHRELEKLAQQAKALQKEAERMARKLERLSAPQAAQKMRDAAQRLEEAAQQADNLNPGQLQQEIDQAEKDLEEAQKELEEQQEKVEQDLAQEQAARLAQSVQQLVVRQERIRGELQRLDELQQGSERLTEAQQQTLQTTSLEQATLTGEIRAFAETIAKAEVFHLSLQLTAEVTTDLSRLLDAGTLDAQTLALADEAVARLQQLAAALEEDAKNRQQQDEQEKQDQQQQDQQQQQQQGAQDGISQTAQLRLLKMMQEALKTRTETFAERMAQQPDAVDRNELARLAAEQGRLSEMTMNLMPNVQEDLFDPEQLPEMLPTEPAPGDEEAPNVE